MQAPLRGTARRCNPCLHPRGQRGVATRLHAGRLYQGGRDGGPRSGRRPLRETQRLVMAPSICINNRRIGPGYPAYIIAELSGNHGQDFERAVRLVREARAAGADAVKLQTYTADTLTI